MPGIIQKNRFAAWLLATAAGFVVLFGLLVRPSGAETLHFLNFGLRELAKWGVFLVSWFGWGMSVLRLGKFTAKPGLTGYLLAAALGMGVMAHLVLFAGFLGWLVPAAAYAVIAAGLLLAVNEFYRRREHLKERLQDWVQAANRISIFGGILLGLLVLSWLYPAFAEMLVPPNISDEVSYHLPVPQIYIENRQVVPVSYIPHSNWPLEIEMIFTVDLLLGQETQARMVGWAAQILTSLLLAGLGRRYFSLEAGLAAAVVYSSTPIIETLAGTAFIDLPLALFTLCALACLLQAVENGWEQRTLVLSALFAGLAASTKFNANLTAAVFGLFVLGGMLLAGERKRAFGQFLLYGMTAGLVVLPWYARTWIFTGNPFWPNLYGLFGGRYWDELGNEMLYNFVQSINMAPTFRNWLFGLWELTVNPYQYAGPRLEIGYVYAGLLPVSLLAAVFLLHSREKRIYLAVFLPLAGLYSIWFFTTNQARFLIPALPLLAFLVGAGTGKILELVGGYWQAAVKGGLLVLFASQAWVLVPQDWQTVQARWGYLGGSLSRDAFYSQTIRGYEVFQYANTVLDDDDRVMIGLFEVGGYFLEKPYTWANPVSQRIYRFEEYAGPAELKEVLQQAGITHILNNRPQINRFKSLHPYGNEVADLWNAFLAEETVLLYEADSLALYRVNYGP